MDSLNLTNCLLPGAFCLLRPPLRLLLLTRCPYAGPVSEGTFSPVEVDFKSGGDRSRCA
jgi:hypothetical protein